jgi:hypothetical protein
MRYAYCALWMLYGCNSVTGGAASIESPLIVRSQSSAGTPLAGVILEVDGRQATTGADGTVALKLTGSEGARREIAVTCPEDHQPPASPLVVSIRKPAGGAGPYHYDVVCTPLHHTVVVVGRVINGPNLPILHLGAPIGRTNRDGIAHAAFTVGAGESIRLTLDTEDTQLLPRSPSFDFPGVERDEIVTITQTFELPPEPKPVRHRPAKKREADDRPRRL